MKKRVKVIIFSSEDRGKLDKILKKAFPSSVRRVRSYKNHLLLQVEEEVIENFLQECTAFGLTCFVTTSEP